MKIFQCNKCHNLIFFENTVCEKCGSLLGYLDRQNVLSALIEEGNDWRALADATGTYRFCSNHAHGVCNWLVPADRDVIFCTACTLNSVIPDLDNPEYVSAWRRIEYAKHRLVYSLIRLGLPLDSKSQAPESGLSFEFRSDAISQTGPADAKTGHAHGTITINVAEADVVKREQTRERLAEPYRTLIGHFRHESGHYYWERMVNSDAAVLEAFRGLFGDERSEYANALQQYYEQGPPHDWRDRHISAYSSAHPWEDWAETWAHYLHLVDTLETAHAFRISLNPNLDGLDDLEMTADFDPYGQSDFHAITAAAIPLSIAINSLNRSMGQPDLYPFTLPAPVMEKLHFIHNLLAGHRGLSSAADAQK